MMKKVMMLMMAVAVAAAAQAVTVSFDGGLIDPVTGQIQMTPGAVDTVWGTTTLLIDAPAPQADIKFAMSQVGTTHRTAQINKAGYIYAGGGGSTTQFDKQDPPQPKIDAVSGFSQIVAFDTGAFGAADLLSLSVDIEPRYTG